MVITRKNFKRSSIEIKLPNDGFIYRELIKFHTPKTDKWHNRTNRKILSQEQRQAAFPSISTFLKNTVHPLFDSSQDFWIQLLYHEEDKRFDIVVDDGFFFFQINFEPNYPVFDHNAKIK